MRTKDIPSQWELSTTNRLVRGVIGTASILSALLNDELSGGWVFILVVLGLYASQSAFFNVELLRAFFTLPGVDEMTDQEVEVVKTPSNTIEKLTPKHDEEELS